MPIQTATTSISDFAGFIDRFEAQNLDTVKRSVAIQVAEMSLRGKVILQLLGEGPDIELRSDVASLVKSIEDSNSNIVEKLTNVGKMLLDILITHGDQLKGQQKIFSQLKGFVLAYIEAAETSRTSSLTDIAFSVAQAIQQI